MIPSGTFPTMGCETSDEPAVSVGVDDMWPDYPDVVVGVVVVNSNDPMKLATFWSQLLDREIVAEDENWVNLVWSPRYAVGMSFQRTSEVKDRPNRLHLDIFCGDLGATAQRVERLGGRRAPDHDGAALVMLDPEDNEFCLLPMPG